MDSSQLIASIAVALDKLRCRREQSNSRSDDINLETMMQVLRIFRTFLLWSTKLTENSNDSLCSQEQMMMKKQDNSRMKRDLGSVLVQVEDVIRKILDDHIPYEPNDFLHDIESCEGEMDNWYARLSYYLVEYSTSPVADQFKVITDSVLENLKDYLSSERSYGFELEEECQQIQALKKNITFMRNIIHFGTLLCTENLEFRCLLYKIEPLAISAAHLTLHLFSDIRRPMHLPNDLRSSMLSALLLQFNHVWNTLPLASLKHSRELCDPDLNDYPFIIQMDNCIVFLLSTLWETLELVSRVSLKELQLYERLELLRTILKRQPDLFRNDKIRDITAAAVGDAGVRILSLCQKDLGTDNRLNLCQENSEVIWPEVLSQKLVETSRLQFPETNVLGFLDFLLEDYLMDVCSSSIDSNTLSCVPKIREHLVFLKSFIEKLVELRNQHENLYQDVWNHAVEVAYKIEFLVDQLVLGDVLDSFSMSLRSISENIMIFKADSLNIFSDQGREEIYKVQQITWPSTDKVGSISSSLVADEVVGFESEKASIVDRLKRGMKKLQVVAVVGMAGLGKTTLATKVYRDSSVLHHFPVKACCSISQVFDRRKVLLELLCQIQPGKSYITMTDDDLSQQLWRSLRKRRYLIFIDDIWDTEAFIFLKESLPDDSSQSRILLTSRHGDVVPDDLLDGRPLFLRHLTMDESFELLHRKLFPSVKDWPSELHDFGMEIAEYCKGLPLTVVIIAGLLSTTEQLSWKLVMNTLRSSIVSDLTDQCESTIELSYKHLPDYLKPCFLWFGAFPEDHKLSVKRIIWLWIAEGLVRKNELKSLEEVGRDYMNILITRSLVINAENGSVGGVKTCRIHDLLHDFCLRKAKEELFLHGFRVDGSRERDEPSSGEFETLSIDGTKILSSVELRNLRRLCIFSKLEHLKCKVFCPRLRSLLFFCPTERDQKVDLSYIFRMFKFLRVLVIDKVEFTSFPSEIGVLVQLRYLAIQVGDFVGPEIGSLINLETLILDAVEGGAVSLPDTLWNLRKLRHLHSKNCSIELTIDNSDSSCVLLELQTLSTLCVRDMSVMEKQLRKFPNIHQMKCEVMGYCKVLDFSFLSQLESLALFSYVIELCELILPENIKDLTLYGTNFPWNKIGSIAKLPHLEILKLLRSSFLGDTWHIEEGEFPKLKFLMLQSLNLVNWTAASEDLFPNLEKLVFEACRHLKEIPECLENVATLETIEVYFCPDHVVSLAKGVEEFQKEMGNSVLQFHERRAWQLTSDSEFSDDEQTSTDSEDSI